MPECRTISQFDYQEVLTTLYKWVRKVEQILHQGGRIAHWILCQFNAPGTQCAVFQVVFGEAENPHVGPSAILTCDIFLFSNIKSALKSMHFESIDAVKTKATKLMKKLSE